MTVSSETVRKTYAGNGVTVAFSTSPVIFYDSGDLEVYDVLDSTGVATLKTETTHYAVTGGDGSTGTVTMVTAPASGHTLVIMRALPVTQDVNLVDNDIRDAEVMERALDRLTLEIQELRFQLSRTARLPDSDVSGADISILPATEGYVLGWNDDGDLTSLAAVDFDALGVTVSAFAETLLDDANAAAARSTLGVAGTTEAATHASLTLTGLTAGRVMLVGTADAVVDSDSFTYDNVSTNRGIYVSGSGSGSNALRVTNTHASGAAILIAKTDGSGDAYVQFDIGPASSAIWHAGPDNSVSNQFTIGPGAAPGTTDALTISTAGVVTLPNGQLTFPAAQNAAAGANTLDDYERGTWTPVLSDGTNNATSGAAMLGNYQKIGDRVFIECDIVTTALGSVSGALRVTGLPFAKRTGVARGTFVAAVAGGLAITAGMSLNGHIAGTNQYMVIDLWDNVVGDTTMLDTEWTDDGACSFSGHYIATT